MTTTDPTTNPIRDALALVVVDYFDEALQLTAGVNDPRSSRDLVDDLERVVTDALVRQTEAWAAAAAKEQPLAVRKCPSNRVHLPHWFRDRSENLLSCPGVASKS